MGVVRYWPLGKGRIVTSPFGSRDGGFHSGCDFGREGGSAGMTVYAVQAGTVQYAGAALGYGGPDPAGWLVIDSTDVEGGGCLEYGHIVRRPEVRVGTHVDAGQPIGVINPNRATNANVAPHLHLSDMPAGYQPAAKQDPLPRLRGAREPEPSTPAKENTVGWNGDPTWLADTLRSDGGINVKTLPGWDKAGHGDFKDIRGVMIHHTGNARESAQSIRNGRPDLSGPLANLHIAPDGTVTVVAVGVCWHAGIGSYPFLPPNMGNWHMIGIELAWPRDTSITPATQARELWPAAQIIAVRNVAAALCRRLSVGSDRVIGHKDYAAAAQGKWDPGNLDMPWFRAEVAKDLAGFVFPGEGTATATPAPIPAPMPAPNQYANILLYKGMVGLPVSKLQTRLQRNYSKLVADGVFGARTYECVRDYQRLHPPLDPDGVVGPATAASLGLVL